MTRHPERDLPGFVQSDLEPAARRRVAAHLEGCPACREAAETYRRLLAALAAEAPAPPPVDWGPWQTRLRARLRAGERRPAPAAWLWGRAVPLAVAGALAAGLLLMVIGDGLRPPAPGGALTAFEEVVLGDRLDLLERVALLERLDLLEDLEAIAALDRLAPAGEG